MARSKRTGKASAASAQAEIVPPQIASAKTPATRDDVLPSIESPATALQEVSGNKLKRPRDTTPDKDDDPYENTPSPKRTPTPQCFTASGYRAFREKHPVRPWKERKISGQYTLISCKSDIGHYVDTTGFEVKVFYDCRDAEERKLYATFKFDKLEGIIRMRRYGDLPTDKGERRRLTAEEFDEACILRGKYWAKRDNPEFSCRWRGKECSQRIIDGEFQDKFEFHEQESTSPNGFPDMKIKFGIFYDDETFRFKAAKTADLDSTDLERLSSLEEEWQALHDPNPDAKYKIEFEEMKDEDWFPVRKRMYPCNKKRKAEYHPFSNGSRMFSGVTTVASLPNAPALKKTTGWPVSGLYRLTCTNRLDPVDAADYCFELHYTTELPRQLFATFEFGNLKGIMRLCPEKALTSRSDKSLSMVGFGNACQLDEKTRPGPSCKNWLSRWRAREGDVLKGGETRAQGQFTIKKDPVAPGSDLKCFKLVFVMVIDGKHLAFEGVHAAPLDPPGPDFILEKEWKTLLNPNWELGEVSTPYESGSIIQIKHKPTPATASDANVVQERPDWAWDITGEWTLTDDDIMRSIGLPKTTKCTMSIFLANNPRHKKIQRQYWAIFKFGDSVEGCMRFCLPSEKGSRGTIKEFEESCVLDDDDWVGAPPQGVAKLQYRWRARDCETGEKPSWYHEYQQGMDFKMGDDGKLSMTAVMTVGWQPKILYGVKTRNGEPRKGNAPTVKTVWDSFKEREEYTYDFI